MGHFPSISNFRIYSQKAPEKVRDSLKGETAVEVDWEVLG